MVQSIVKTYRQHKTLILSYNALLSGVKQLAKLARNEREPTVTRPFKQLVMCLLQFNFVKTFSAVAFT